MLIKRKKREIPQVNSSASADIAFLLLVFFLIASSMGSEKGIFKRLLPNVSENVVEEKKEIQKRNLLVIKIDAENQVFCGEMPTALGELKKIASDFISNPENEESLPEKNEKEIPLLGKIPVSSNHIISLQISRNSSYNTYLSVQNELHAAYNSLRNELSMNRFNKLFAALDVEQQTAIREVYPQRIAENEIKEDNSSKETTNKGGKDEQVQKK